MLSTLRNFTIDPTTFNINASQNMQTTPKTNKITTAAKTALTSNKNSTQKPCLRNSVKVVETTLTSENVATCKTAVKKRKIRKKKKEASLNCNLEANKNNTQKPCLRNCVKAADTALTSKNVTTCETAVKKQKVKKKKKEAPLNCNLKANKQPQVLNKNENFNLGVYLCLKRHFHKNLNNSNQNFTLEEAVKNITAKNSPLPLQKVQINHLQDETIFKRCNQSQTNNKIKNVSQKSLASLSSSSSKKRRLRNRVRIINNKIFSHIKDLFSSDQNNRTPLQKLQQQIAFAAKFRVLTFKLCLMAFKNEGLYIEKNKTITQGSYCKESSQKIALEECHISCIPNIKDNSKVLKVAQTYIEKLKNNINIDIKTTLKKYFFTKEKKEIKDIKNLFCLYKDYSSLPHNTNFLGYTAKKILDSIFIQEEPDLSSSAFCKLQKLLTKNIQSMTDKKEIEELETIRSQVVKKKRKCLIYQTQKDFLEKRLAIFNAKISIKPTPQDLSKAKRLKGAIRSQDRLLRKGEKQHFFLFEKVCEILLKEESSLSHLQMILDFANSNDLPNTLKKNLLNFSPSVSKSIVPLNSLLGYMLSATLKMPAVINHGVDNETDLTHSKVATLLTEFSQIKNSNDMDFNKYLNQYMTLLKDTYKNYSAGKNPKNLPIKSLEEIIKNNSKRPNQALKKFITENESSIAEYFLKNVTDANGNYDKDFEIKVMGQLIKDPTVLTTPSINMMICEICKKAWKKPKPISNT